MEQIDFQEFDLYEYTSSCDVCGELLLLELRFN